MNPVLDGWLVLQQQPTPVVLVLGFMLWGVVLGIGLLRRYGLLKLGPDDMLSLASGVWMPAALLISGLALALGAVSSRAPDGLLVFAVPVFSSVCWIWPHRLVVSPGRRRSWLTAMFLAAAFVVLMLLRLAFMKGLALPAYFDSATHFGLIQQLVRSSGSAGWQLPLMLPVPGYYHLGYHVLIAGLVRLTGMEIAPAMLISGQLTLATLPISLYLLAHRSTDSRFAGIFAVTLGALGWYMPAHALNWGKYPAIFGLPGMLGAVSLACLATGRDVAVTARRALWSGAALCALTAVLIHTRLGLVLTLLAGAWVLSGIWITLTPLRRALWTALLFLAASIFVALISRDPVQRQVLDPFVSSGIWATTLVCLSWPLAFRAVPRITFVLTVLVASLLACLFVPGPAGSLLDRPLVEMLVPLPLSLLGAAGVAGFLQILPRPARSLGLAAGILLAAAVVGNALVTQGFSASSCCAMVSTDDLVALDWIRREVPADVHVAVAVEPLQVSRAGSPSLDAGADAGIWVQPLSGRSIVPLSFVTDFGSEATHSMLCQTPVDLVYAGSAARGFDVAALLAEPQWYAVRLQLPAVLVFEVTACGPSSG